LPARYINERVELYRPGSESSLESQLALVGIGGKGKTREDGVDAGETEGEVVEAVPWPAGTGDERGGDERGEDSACSVAGVEEAEELA
jgi:hypothetical protein